LPHILLITKEMPMPRRKDQERIDEIFSTLQKSLKTFTEEIKGPLTSWMKKQNMETEEVMKMLMEARSKASELRFVIENLEDVVRDGKTLKNSRFASNVVRKFLESLRA
jgi:BMFP domain-containing protein YqiC